MAECATAARKAIELNPSSAPAHFRLAIALFHQARLDEAARAFERTIAVDPEYVIAWYHLGVIRERQKNVDNAIALLREGRGGESRRRVGPLPPGPVLRAQGLDGLAISALSRALELDPSDTAAAAALQELQR